MTLLKPIIKLKSIDKIWKDSLDILSTDEVSLIQKSLKYMSNEIKEVKDSKQPFSQAEISLVSQNFGDMINDFVTHFDFNRVIILSQRRSIAKYCYHILISLIDILESNSLNIDKESLFKSCQICLNYYFPSKALKNLESHNQNSDPESYLPTNNLRSNKSLDFIFKTPPRNLPTFEKLSTLPNPSPFNTSQRSPSRLQNSGSQHSITRYNSSENCLYEDPNGLCNLNAFENPGFESEFFPNDFQFPMPIEEAKRRLREKLLKKEISGIRKSRCPNLGQEFPQILRRNKSLFQSWGSEETDKSDLQIEDLGPSNILQKNIKLQTQRIKFPIQVDEWESTKVAAHLAETLPEPQRTRRIRKEIYQQSIWRSVELLKDLEVCQDLKPNVLTKTMFHTIENIIDYC
ncbi:hypothetical protein HWI79_2432 [Cryptosporidium felis]|nr:hypothetical protein HWI79_2432 [Cryptosporidium felis]